VTEDLVSRAREYGTRAHRRIDQQRKYTHQPYEVHLKAVSQLLSEVLDDPAVLAAAWLHDTVEDTEATLEDIRSEFRGRVARLVGELTDVSKPSDGNRAVRKAIDRAHLAGASPEAKTVKLADLIDNCRDICTHDKGFCRVYLGEMAALLGVLGDGDALLLERAKKTWRKHAASVGLPTELLEDDAAHGMPVAPALANRIPRLFIDAFTAEAVAEPLISFDAERRALAVAEQFAKRPRSVIGIRRDGRIGGYALVADLVQGTCGAHLRMFHPGQLLPASAPFADVIQVLTRHKQAFVEVFGQVGGIITRRDMQKPVVRMWLFGIITLTEMRLTQLIRERFPESTWSGLMTPSRLAKAQALRAERERLGQQVELIDCLQLGDKARIVVSEPSLLDQFGFESRGAAKQVVKEFESLRNHLAHAQDIVSHHWAQIARIARRLEMQDEPPATLHTTRPGD
jgi:hypothetical protein